MAPNIQTRRKAVQIANKSGLWNFLAVLVLVGAAYLAWPSILATIKEGVKEAAKEAVKETLKEKLPFR
jgi:threonine/homoserine/homoserine lactone efflux protein